MVAHPCARVNPNKHLREQVWNSGMDLFRPFLTGEFAATARFFALT